MKLAQVPKPFSRLSAIAALVVALAGLPAAAAGGGHEDGKQGTTVADEHVTVTQMPEEPIGFTPCVQGKAGPFRCHQADLLTFWPPSEFGGGPSSGFGGPGNDVWGWTDPETRTEWVIMGRSNGTSFIDISDPKNPVLVADLPRHQTNALWSDIKVYENYAFVVKEGSGNGMQVFDLTRLRDIDYADAPVTVDEDAHYNRFGNSHNLFINEDTGFAYAVGTTGDVPGASANVVTIDPPSSAAGTYQATGANFGPAPDETGVSGDVVLVNDGVGTTTDGCEPLVGFPAGSIALVDRGICSFVQKANNAQDAGAVGMIVANNVGGNPITMGGTDPSIAISSVMVSLDDGNTIKAGLPASGTVTRNPEGNPCRVGLHIVDISDPLTPTFAGCFDEDGNTHDVQCVIYHGPDERYQGREICFASNNSGAFGGPRVTTVDVTDKSNMVILSRTPQGAPAAFSHQGWLTEDHRYFLHDDESDEIRFGGRTRTRVFDTSDLENVFVQAVYHGETRAADHNLYVRGRYAYEANYFDGLRVINITKIDHPGDEFAPETPSAPDHQGLREVACFDTDPTRNDIPGFGGSWSNYPFFKSGVVAVSGFDGLFLVKPRIGVKAAFPDGSGKNEPSGNPGGNSGGGTAGCL
jgi:choice-of-anchor B domain-containing protein